MNTEEKKVYELAEEDTKTDVFELLFVLKQKLLILLLVFVIAAAGAGFYTARFAAPAYKAESIIYISTKSTGFSAPAGQSAGQTSADFRIMASTREVLNSVVDDLSLSMNYETLRKKVKVSTPFHSHMLKITVTDTNAQRAADIANTLADELRQRIADVMYTDMPTMAERAEAPGKTSGPSALQSALLAGCILALLTAAVILVNHLRDDTLHTEEDIKRYLKLNNLAMIPLDKSRSDREDQPKKRGGGKRKK